MCVVNVDVCVSVAVDVDIRDDLMMDCISKDL